LTYYLDFSDCSSPHHPLFLTLLIGLSILAPVRWSFDDIRKTSLACSIPSASLLRWFWSIHQRRVWQNTCLPYSFLRFDVLVSFLAPLTVLTLLIGPSMLSPIFRQRGHPLRVYCLFLLRFFLTCLLRGLSRVLLFPLCVQRLTLPTEFPH